MFNSTEKKTTQGEHHNILDKEIKKHQAKDTWYLVHNKSKELTYIYNFESHDKSTRSMP